MKDFINPYDIRTVQKLLFAHCTPGFKDRRTRTYLRKLARHISHGYEIGFRDAMDGKELVHEEDLIATVPEAARDAASWAFIAYQVGYNNGFRVKEATS